MLLEQVRSVIRKKHFSLRTEQAYVSWIRRFILVRPPAPSAEMAEA
ncbi:MAG: phage integrase N-terminal SAM-like domain-containing protein [Pyrinomonadaceae bacterium]